ncbi:MAG TPA: hypothetical protein VK915_13805 [Gaiellaceae bacterium]|nr:hypothetical protein [Gaiellaceae bacterium]
MAPEDDIRDPRAFRWVESGVSGLARPRRWDATGLAEVEALRGSDVSELEFRVRADGSVLGDVPADAVEALTAGIALDPPYGVRAVRKSDLEWAVGASEDRSEPLELPEGIVASLLEVALPPEGEATVIVDGEVEPEELPDAEAAAVRELERIGRERFQAFVARADRVEGRRWELTVDPL